MNFGPTQVSQAIALGNDTAITGMGSLFPSQLNSINGKAFFIEIGADLSSQLPPLAGDPLSGGGLQTGNAFQQIPYAGNYNISLNQIRSQVGSIDPSKFYITWKIALDSAYIVRNTDLAVDNALHTTNPNREALSKKVEPIYLCSDQLQAQSGGSRYFLRFGNEALTNAYQTSAFARFDRDLPESLAFQFPVSLDKFPDNRVQYNSNSPRIFGTRDLSNGLAMSAPYYECQFVESFNIRFVISAEIGINSKPVWGRVKPQITEPAPGAVFTEDASKKKGVTFDPEVEEPSSNRGPDVPRTVRPPPQPEVPNTPSEPTSVPTSGAPTPSQLTAQSNPYEEEDRAEAIRIKDIDNQREVSQATYRKGLQDAQDTYSKTTQIGNMASTAINVASTAAGLVYTNRAAIANLLSPTPTSTFDPSELPLPPTTRITGPSFNNTPSAPGSITSTAPTVLRTTPFSRMGNGVGGGSSSAGTSISRMVSIDEGLDRFTAPLRYQNQTPQNQSQNPIRLTHDVLRMNNPQLTANDMLSRFNIFSDLEREELPQTTQRTQYEVDPRLGGSEASFQSGGAPISFRDSGTFSEIPRSLRSASRATTSTSTNTSKSTSKSRRET